MSDNMQDYYDQIDEIGRKALDDTKWREVDLLAVASRVQMFQRESREQLENIWRVFQEDTSRRDSIMRGVVLNLRGIVTLYVLEVNVNGMRP